MKPIVVALLLVLGFSNGDIPDTQPKVCCALPNPKLLTCKSADCSQLWSEALDPNVIYPKQVIVDINNNCAYGLQAMYDKSVSIDEIKTAIDQRYKQWAKPLSPNVPPYIWRVEPGKFAIQLSTTSKQAAKMTRTEAGTSTVIYIAFGGQAACAN